MIENLSRFYYNQGLRQARERQIGTAVQSLTKSVSYDSGNIQAWNLAGLCYYRLGKYKTAQYCWKQSLQRQVAGNAAAEYLADLSSDLEEAAPYFAMVASLSKNRKYKQAAAVLSKEICSRFDSGTALLNYLGLLLALSGRISGAVKCWTTALSIDRSNAAAAQYLAAMENRLSYRLLKWKEGLWQSKPSQKG